MSRFFRAKDKEDNSKPEVAKGTDHLDFQVRDLYKKGVNYMSNDKLSDAIRSFELALRLDPNYVEAWIKKGYAHFHLRDYSFAISSYDMALNIDPDNHEAWNLKGLAYYKMNNYTKAIECCTKALDSNPSDGLVWYNYACYLTLDGKIDNGMEALKRAIEIDISHAKKAVRDKDFENARAEEGFMRIIEVVVLESLRQGYDYAGKIVWATGMDSQDVQEAIMRLSMKGLVTIKQKKSITGKEEYYELSRDISDKLGEVKRSGFLKPKEYSAPIQEIKDIIEILDKSIESVKNGDLNQTMDSFEQLTNPSKHGNTMIEQFFDQHRDLRLYQARLNDKGQEYLDSHKSELTTLLEDIIEKVRSGPLSRTI
ncbi:MAG TPA: tetratricopeptide repeat protein [Nitrososphaeraceae archaeon]|jgi:tetratricopeptide (TPR) repeat protein|nr:tetratricopeptide repeat protein [Nitrososphaeraceae archaeon]